MYVWWFHIRDIKRVYDFYEPPMCVLFSKISKILLKQLKEMSVYNNDERTKKNFAPFTKIFFGRFSGHQKAMEEIYIIFV